MDKKTLAQEKEEYWEELLREGTALAIRDGCDVWMIGRYAHEYARKMIDIGEGLAGTLLRQGLDVPQISRVTRLSEAWVRSLASLELNRLTVNGHIDNAYRRGREAALEDVILSRLRKRDSVETIVEFLKPYISPADVERVALRRGIDLT